jgi:putative hemolysin
MKTLNRAALTGAAGPLRASPSDAKLDARIQLANPAQAKLLFEGKSNEMTAATTHNILGISAYYHDSAAALLQDEELVASAQQERFTRKRHDAGFPAEAILYCLEAGGSG